MLDDDDAPPGQESIGGGSQEADMKSAALAYAKAGVKVLPLHFITNEGRCSCGAEKCKSPGKHPLSMHGVRDASSDPAKVAATWDATPDANIGGTPGPLGDGFTWFALDIDQGRRIRGGKPVDLIGESELAELEKRFGEPVDKGVVQISGSGARHLIVVMPDGHRTPRKLSPAIDIIGPGKYIVLAPSNHKSGKDYRWRNGPVEYIAEYFADAAKAPKWVLEFDQPAAGKTKTGGDDGDDLRSALKLDLTPEQFESAVMAVPNRSIDVEYDDYFRMLQAIHHQSNGDDWGLDLAHKWAAQSDKYDDRDVDRRWDSIRDDGANLVTGKYVIWEAQKNGWKQPKRGNRPPRVDGVESPLTDYEIAVERLNQNHAHVVVGDSSRILKEVRLSGGGPVKDLVFMRVDAFKNDLLGEKYDYPSPTDSNPARMKPRSIGDIWFHAENRRSYGGLCFEPNPKKVPRDSYNMYRGIVVPKGDFAKPEKKCSILLEHLRENVAGGNLAHFDWIIAWYAQTVQEPWRKTGHGLVLIGDEGAGKTIVGDIFGRLWGRHHTKIDDPDLLYSQFNWHIGEAILLQVEEATWGGDLRHRGKLLSLVTSVQTMIQRKGVDAYTANNYSRVLITTNNAWAIPAGINQRRFAVFRVSDVQRQNHAYFDAMWRQMENGGFEALHQILADFDLKSVNLHEIPKTRELAEQKRLSIDAAGKFIQELLASGDEEIWDGDEHGAIERQRLAGRAERFYRNNRLYWRGLDDFLKHAKSYLPPFKPNERRRKGPRSANGRTRVVVFPPLAECQAYFDRRLGLDSGDDEEPRRRPRGDFTDIV